jgi:hypothetical protein
VLFLQPDRALGWKQASGLHWTWGGHYWYAADFSVDIQTNPLGFRDIIHEIHKPSGVKRVALLGDSFIEAAQVPFEKTSGQLLEKKLNASSNKQQWEVLNFGISNYGVGQYLLAWEQYARNYNPDYVAIFVANFHMKRTVSKFEYGAFPASEKTALWVRPTFRLENNELIREPARDFDEFVRVQDHLINSEFAGQRSRRKTPLITLYYAGLFKQQFTRLINRINRGPGQASAPPKVEPYTEGDLLAVNQKIIEELGRNVTGAGSKMVVLDVSRYFGDNESISTALKELCGKNGFGYVPLYDDLLKANKDGISTSWAHDGHFNEAGNEIMAKALLGWITQ